MNVLTSMADCTLYLIYLWKQFLLCSCAGDFHLEVSSYNCVRQLATGFLYILLFPLSFTFQALAVLDCATSLSVSMCVALNYQFYFGIILVIVVYFAGRIGLQVHSILSFSVSLLVFKLRALSSKKTLSGSNRSVWQCSESGHS